jgi:hypothetical protein
VGQPEQFGRAFPALHADVYRRVPVRSIRTGSRLPPRQLGALDPDSHPSNIAAQTDAGVRSVADRSAGT